MSTAVCLARCRDYEQERVADAVALCLESLPGIDSLLKEGNRVLIKPNLLSPRPPEDGVTTHPSLVQAVVDFVKKRGCLPVIGDSHGGYERKTAEVWERTGMKRVARVSETPLVNFEASGARLESIHGRKYPVARAVSECDVIISLPKLKTHMVTTLTGGVKNAFGCIPGFRKALYHRDLHSVWSFCRMLTDVCQMVSPQITVMDAVVSMDGNGPAAGRLRSTGLVIASRDPYALDAGVAALMGVPFERVPTLAIALRRRLGPRSREEIDFIGEAPSESKTEDFRLPRGGELPPILAAVVGRALWVRPRIDYAKCTSCGDCYRNCPVEAIEVVNGSVLVDLKRCISCFCCQEMCPSGAISPIRSRHLKMVHR